MDCTIILPILDIARRGVAQTSNLRVMNHSSFLCVTNCPWHHSAARTYSNVCSSVDMIRTDSWQQISCVCLHQIFPKHAIGHPTTCTRDGRVAYESIIRDAIKPLGIRALSMSSTVSVHMDGIRASYLNPCLQTSQLKMYKGFVSLLSPLTPPDHPPSFIPCPLPHPSPDEHNPCLAQAHGGTQEQSHEWCPCPRAPPTSLRHLPPSTAPLQRTRSHTHSDPAII